MEEGLAQRDKSLQLVVQRLEETMSEAAKEREHLAASLQAVAEGGQRELCSAEDRLLRHQQKAELRCGEVSCGEGSCGEVSCGEVSCGG